MRVVRRSLQGGDPTPPQGDHKGAPLLWTSLARRCVEQVRRAVRRSLQTTPPRPRARTSHIASK
jgi:hypothetical protein